MKNLTRRGLLKTGLIASAGLIGSREFLPEGAAEEAVPATRSHAGGSERLEEPFSSRQRLLLDFGWKFHLGDADDATKDFSFGLPAIEGTFAKAGQIVGHNNVHDGKVVQLERDDSGWESVDLPHDWAVGLPFVQVERYASEHAAHGSKPLGRDFPGTSIGWYRRRFNVPVEEKGMRFSLEFDGVFRDAMVVLNGFYLGRNMSGYVPFSYDITDFVSYGGENLIEVRVDATLNEGWFYEGAGIYRHVWLTKTQPLHVAKWGTWVRSEIVGAEARVLVQTELENDSDDAVRGHLTSRIFGPDGELAAVIQAKAFEIAARSVITVETRARLAKPALWSIEMPQLYRIVTQVESGGRITDHDDVTFGVRSIRFDPDHGFFLNDKQVKIMGTCNHQDHAGVGIGVPDRIHADRVAVMKQMGSNGWRTAHSMVAAEVLDACDRQGMMVMAETRLMSSSEEGLSELERMVKRDRNHPSIIIWSLANEEHYQGNDTGAMILASMKRLCKKLDPTRPVTGAMNGGWGKGISGVVDVQGFNYWNGGGDGSTDPAKNIDSFHAEFPHLPMVGTETANAKSARGIYATDPARGYVSGYKAGCADCKLPAEIWWAAYDKREYLSGGFTWTGFDYRGEPKPYDHIAISSQSGIVDTCGFPKDIYYYYQSCWGTEPVLHLFPHWNWAGKEGAEIDVRCFTNLDSVELLLNGRSVGSKAMTRDSHLYWAVKYEPGMMEARGSKGGRVVLTERRETTGEPVKMLLRPNRNEVAADGEDVVSFAVEVQDAKGRMVPTASNKIDFRLTGAGRILGVGNGDPSCREDDRPASMRAASRSAFNGLCMVFVQSTKEAGEVQMEASAVGLQTARVSIPSRATKPRPAVD